MSTPKTNMKSENVQAIGCCGDDENEKMRYQETGAEVRVLYDVIEGKEKTRNID